MRLSPSGPNTAAAVNFGAGALQAFGTGQSETFSAIDSPGTFPAVVDDNTGRLRNGVTISEKSVVSHVRVRQRVAGGDAQLLVYQVQKMASTTPELGTPVVADCVGATVSVANNSIQPVETSVGNPFASSADAESCVFQPGDVMLLRCTHPVLVGSGPADIEVEATLKGLLDRADVFDGP